MASIDEGQYSLTSEEKFDFECSLCKNGDITREATYFCPDCSEYYCDSCEISHRRMKVTKNHTVLSGSDLNMVVEKKTECPFVMICACNHNRSVNFICDKHECLVCSDCKTINHRKCNTDSIKDRSKRFNTDTINSSLKQTTRFLEKARQLQEKQSENIDILEKEKFKCRDKIRAVGNDLHMFIDKIANESLEELDRIIESDIQFPENNRSVCISAYERLALDQKTLQDSSLTNDISQMFIANYVVSKLFDNYKTLLEDIESQTKTRSLDFEPDKTLKDMQATVKKLGDIKVDTSGGSDVDRKDIVETSLLAISAVKAKTFDITPPGASRMTGSMFLSNGDFLVCDFNLKMIRFFDAEFKEKTKLQLPDSPWTTTTTKDSNLIVSFTNLKKLANIEIASHEIKSYIELDKKCFDVKTDESKIFVACTNDPGQGEVRILDLKGNKLKSVGLNPDGTYMLNRPLHLAISCSQECLYVSDYSDSSVLCMTMDGKILSKFKDINVKYPRGSLLDMDNNFLVCASDGIYRVNNNGGKHDKFLMNKDSICDPYSLSYRGSDGTLVVTCSSKLLLFELKQDGKRNNEDESKPTAFLKLMGKVLIDVQGVATVTSTQDASL